MPSQTECGQVVVAYPVAALAGAGAAACRARRVKGKVCMVLSLVVYSRKGPPGPCPLVAMEVQLPWIGLLPQYSCPPSESPTAGAVLGPACM